MAQLELKIMAGAESKAWLADLTKIVERMEKAMNGKVVTLPTPPVSDDEDEDFEPKPAARATKLKTHAFDEDEDTGTTEEDEDDDVSFGTIKEPAKKTSKKVTASFDDEDEGEEDEMPAPKAAKSKTTKPKKTTLDDVNDACIARATRGNRAEVLGILKKKFKVKSVTDLEPEHYEAVVKAMLGK